MQDIATELAALDRMTTGDLADRYRELHGQPCRTRHRAYLIRKIAWRIQAKAEAWWKARSHEPFPDSSQRAVDICAAGGIAPTLAITARSVTGEKYDRITKHQLCPIPPLLDGRDEYDDGAAVTEEEIPF